MRMLLLAAIAGLALSSSNATAQFGSYPVPNWGPGFRGNISPYLNIQRFNNNNFNNAGINYYLGTRAEQQRRLNAQEFRDELNTLPGRDRVLGEDLTEPTPNVPIPSGAYSVFNNTGGYFNNTAGVFAYPTRGVSPTGIRPGTQAGTPRKAGTASRTGASPGFTPRTGVGR